MDRKQAESDIVDVFKLYGATSSPKISKLGSTADGKVFELWILSELLEEIAGKGYTIQYSHPGSTIPLPGGPCKLDQNSPHFDVFAPGSNGALWQVFLSVEFRTLGAKILDKSGPSSHGSGGSHLSSYHEIDVGVFKGVQADGRPQHDQVVLATECKAVRKGDKSLVRGALGMRRELSYLTHSQPSAFDSGLPVNANPPSVVRLVCAYSWMDQYSGSPSVYSVDVIHRAP
ncbi:hypothetical protein [Afifella marina]|uniref:Uncharacterized protein n=1 Tax=Afifella marina DSM 2698 TaxID=1120955 RepID=A0A1G5PBB8_AFIMA|nr:hypothetical protein [Afifella marina]MBK1625423.1 hypothetical protein [Afifella marina DSM 2698]MBK1629045.1 hypothetical protein [Afifella marina]MBK5918021.1 hypothetical protein [Afifella marina]RAI17553.1 hypothetical protein CH311_17890 [Afifella marina DSM 2698]SCZ46310.1 hypothetical protein SAMN03080610_03620 [Afifella marina DSM 2698]